MNTLFSSSCLSLRGTPGVSRRQPDCGEQSNLSNGLRPQRPCGRSSIILAAQLLGELSSPTRDRVRTRVRQTGDGWTGVGRPMQVGVGYTVRDYCDGQSLASPGRWPVAARQHPGKKALARVCLFRKFSQQFGTRELLMNLALGRVEAMPFLFRRWHHSKARSLEHFENEVPHNSIGARDEAANS